MAYLKAVNEILQEKLHNTRKELEEKFSRNGYKT
jgi:hypothetical protein